MGVFPGRLLAGGGVDYSTPTPSKSRLTNEIALNVNVFVHLGGEDDPMEVPAVVELEAETLWVYVAVDDLAAALRGDA